MNGETHNNQEDIPAALRLLVEMNNNVNQVTDLVETMLQKVKSGEITTENGISFLTVKYHMLLDYLINLTYVVLRKCSGKQIDRKGHAFTNFVRFILNSAMFGVNRSNN